MTTSFDFRSQSSLEMRKYTSTKLREKYPDRVPVIVTRSPNCEMVDQIDKHKYLAPDDITVGQFVYIIRKRIHLSPEKALFVFVNGVLPPTSATISEIYHLHREEDGFLYMMYASENTFGGEP